MSKSLTWSNLDRISIRFNEDVDVRQSDLILQGAASNNLFTSQEDGFEYDATTFLVTWTFSNELQENRYVIRLIDQISNTTGSILDGEFDHAFPSGDGTPGGDFLFEFDVLPGDIDNNGITNDLDGGELRLTLFATPQEENYDVHHDLDGSGRIDIIDGLNLREKIFTNLPIEQLDLEGPSLSASLANDTAPFSTTNDDGLTYDPTIVGIVADPIGVTQLVAALNNEEFVPLVIQPDGTFSFAPDLAIDGSQDGQHSVELIAVDSFGNSSTRNIEFVLDTNAPPAASRQSNSLI